MNSLGNIHLFILTGCLQGRAQVVEGVMAFLQMSVVRERPTVSCTLVTGLPASSGQEQALLMQLIMMPYRPDVLQAERERENISTGARPIPTEACIAESHLGTVCEILIH